MSQNKRISKGKTINPTYFVFCEGETEEEYICFLRSKYRLPILIDSKIAGNRITEKYIQHYKASKSSHPKDKTYLVYDLDVAEMLGKLLSIKDAILLASNPCFEFWYLLHFQDHHTPITSDECNTKLKEHNKSYKKGVFDKTLKETLEEKQAKAIKRAQKLERFKNPSSQLFELIKEMEEVLKLKDQI